MHFSAIKELLEGYKKKIQKEENNRTELCALIFQVSGITLTEKEIDFKKNELVFKGSSVLKNEIFIYKEKIIEVLHKNGYTHISTIS